VNVTEAPCWKEIVFSVRAQPIQKIGRPNRVRRGGAIKRGGHHRVRIPGRRAGEGKEKFWGGGALALMSRVQSLGGKRILGASQLDEERSQRKRRRTRKLPFIHIRLLKRDAAREDGERGT